MIKQAIINVRIAIPSLLTSLSICSSLTGIKMVIENKLEFGVYFLLLAIFLDTIDGRVARYLGAESRFGQELDSLADFFNFAIAPVIFVYVYLFWGTEYQDLGWLCLLIYAVCGGIRLVRFNLKIVAEGSGSSKKGYFSGVPSPALCSLLLMPIYLRLHYEENIIPAEYFLPFIILLSLLSNMNFPTFSLSHPWIKLNLFFNWTISIIFWVNLFLNTWFTMIVINCVYLSLLPIVYIYAKVTSARI